MELIGIERSRIVSLFLLSNPVAQPPIARLAEALVERYQFSLFPREMADLLKDKTEFGQGIFEGHRIDSVEVFTDGVVVTARSNSEVVDRFINDMREWAKSEFGLLPVETHTINKVYESHLIVSSKKNILDSLGRLSKISASIQILLKKSSGIDVELQPSGLSFAADDTKIAGLRPIDFRLERKVNSSFEKGVYYSRSPLQTNDHLRVLEMIESLS